MEKNCTNCTFNIPVEGTNHLGVCANTVLHANMTSEHTVCSRYQVKELPEEGPKKAFSNLQETIEALTCCTESNGRLAMNDNEKQIEEIANIIGEEYNDGNDNWYSIAERIYDKLFSKDSIVLSGEEYTNYMVEYMGVKEIKDRVSKDTARKILKWLIDADAINVALDTIKMYFKEHFGVETM